MNSRFIAVDWGTTNRRVYLIDDRKVLHTARDGMGVLSVRPGGFEAAMDEVRAAHGDLPVLLAGMVGSNRGWVDAGYVAAPAGIEDLARAIVRPSPGIGIVPGVKCARQTRGDVMRGEEVQLLGAVAARLAPPDGLLCQPGTHCKWAKMSGGRIESFVTAMTGELFALLRDHALIGQQMGGVVAPGPAFDDGVAEAANGDLLGALFGVRPASLLGLRDDADAAAYVSGLLIGADCRSHAGERQVYLLADEHLGALYSRAITLCGGEPRLVDSHAAFVAGITRIAELMK